MRTADGWVNEPALTFRHVLDLGTWSLAWSEWGAWEKRDAGWELVRLPGFPEPPYHEPESSDPYAEVSVEEVAAAAPDDVWVNVYVYSDVRTYIVHFDGTSWTRADMEGFALRVLNGRPYLQDYANPHTYYAREDGAWVPRSYGAIAPQALGEYVVRSAQEVEVAATGDRLPTAPIEPSDHNRFHVEAEPDLPRPIGVQSKYGSCVGFGLMGCYPPLAECRIWVPTREAEWEQVATIPSGACGSLIVIDGTLWSAGASQSARLRMEDWPE